VWMLSRGLGGRLAVSRHFLHGDGGVQCCGHQ
jgi:hypothetical protein